MFLCADVKEGSWEESSHWGTLGNVNRCWRNVMWKKIQREREREIREWPLLMRNTGLNWWWRSRTEIALSDPKPISGRDVWEVTSGLQISNPAQRVQNHYIKPGLAKQTTKDEILLPLRRSGDRWLANECCFCDLLMQSKMLLSTSLHKSFIFRWKPVNISSKYFNVLMHNLLNFQHHYSSLQCHMILQISFWFATQETCNISINVENSCAT